MSQAGTVSHFDEAARRWDENPLFQDRARKIADAIRAGVPLSTRMTALDYGCGTGLLSFPLRHELGHITLKDTSSGMLEVLREKIAAQGVTNMTVRQVDLTTAPLPDERYDLIYSSMTLHHIPDTDGILKVFHDLLNPGGWLCIADLDQEDGAFHGPEFDVHHGFDRVELTKRVRNAGFGDVRFETVFEIVKEKADGTRAYPVFMMRAIRPE